MKQERRGDTPKKLDKAMSIRNVEMENDRKNTDKLMEKIDPYKKTMDQLMKIGIRLQERDEIETHRILKKINVLISWRFKDDVNMNVTINAA